MRTTWTHNLYHELQDWRHAEAKLRFSVARDFDFDFNFIFLCFCVFQLQLLMSL